ncbi:hypothetical protein NPIL_81461 [Nephila pilipes]|uniref:Uncharacterized protein n=1 Tax=Nephila pilipes TaxID=299642 RepID=A0A8X6N3N1_NEPPI|nr:hypothetical protein NPIL_81461 [Nephila pilipes]
MSNPRLITCNVSEVKVVAIVMESLQKHQSGSHILRPAPGKVLGLGAFFRKRRHADGYQTVVQLSSSRFFLNRYTQMANAVLGETPSMAFVWPSMARAFLIPLPIC